MRALLLESVHPDAVDLLRAGGCEVRLVERAYDETELVEALAGVQLLGIRSKTDVTATVLALYVLNTSLEGVFNPRLRK